MDGAGGRRLNLAQQARVATSLSQRRFATLLGVSPSVVSRWETGAAPSGPATALLKMIRDHPAKALETLGGPP